jgi:hypothetical protein
MLRSIDPSGSAVCALDLLQYSEDPDARKVLSVYRSIPRSYRRLLSPESFCLAAGVSPWRVLESIVVAAVRLGTQGSILLAAIELPAVVDKLVAKALSDKGAAARTTFLKATGFLPGRC